MTKARSRLKVPTHRCHLKMSLARNDQVECVLAFLPRNWSAFLFALIIIGVIGDNQHAAVFRHVLEAGAVHLQIVLSPHELEIRIDVADLSPLLLQERVLSAKETRAGPSMSFLYATPRTSSFEPFTLSPRSLARLGARSVVGLLQARK
jgi:hypothetical protein